MFTRTIMARQWAGLMAMIAIIAIFAGTTIAAELTGTVWNDETGEPIAGAAVKIKGTRTGTVTDSEGRYRLPDAPSAEVTLLANVIGYNVAYRTVDAEQTGMVDFYLTPKLLKGQDVIVTATRAKQGETPVAFTNVTRAEIEDKYFAQDIPMLLADTPNLFAYSDAGNGIGYSYMRIRGFDQKRIAVMLNGIPLNDAVSGEVFWIDLPDFAESVEDIQIQRGVGNSLYGAAAMGGSVNLITSNFSAQPELKFKSGYGSYNTRKLLLSGNSGLIKDSYVFYGRFSKIDTDGYRDKSWSRMWGYFIGLARYDERSTLKVNFYGGPEESHLAYKGITALQLQWGDRRYNELQYKDEIDHFQQPHYELIHDFRINEKTSLSNTLYYFEGDGYYDQFRSRRYIEEYNLGAIWAGTADEFPSNYYADVDAGGIPIPDSVTGLYELERTDVVRRRVVSENDWGWIPRVTHDFGKGKVVAGGEMRIHEGHHFGEVLWAAAYPKNLDPNVRYYDYYGTRQSYTVFGHLAYDITERLSGMIDLQYQYYGYDLSNEKRFDVSFDRSYNFVTPRFGMNFVISDDITVFGNVSTAARQPAFKDIYDPTDYWSNPIFKPGNFTPISPGYDFVGKELDPEKLFDVEFGGSFKSDLAGNDLNLALNLYRMQMNDEIIPYAGQVDDDGYPISGNADKTLHQGIEISAKFVTTANLKFSGNISVNNDHFEDYTEYGFDWDAWEAIELDRSGNRIGGFPAMLANYNVTYRYYTASFGLYGHFVGEQFLDNSESDERKLENFHVVDLVGSIDIGDEFGVGSMVLSVRVNNLFDTKYAAAGYIEADDGLPRYMVGAERNFFVSIGLGL
ncbi:MAG: TonB-dependent receptor [candidate division Zixibacteria bacterium]